ncbi:MAG: clan AA aspartic protease [Sphingomonadales bacterium]|nr:clan AA aspartic protease [Sphingomonadales bacterium]MDE2171614.1 clan AA aspartic protease [Sphingomonadales bacterium]
MGMLSAALALAMATTAAAGDIPMRADATLPGLSQQTATPDTIATQSDVYNRMTVPISIAGHGSYDFLLDTGAQRSVLASGFAARLGFAAGEPLHVTGLAGARSVNTVMLSGMRLGQRNIVDLEVPVFPDDAMDSPGIIGIDSLKDQRVLLDFRAHRISVEPSAKHKEGDGYEIVVSARRRGGQLILSHAWIDGIDTDIIIDTGADAAIGNLALQRAISHQTNGQSITLTSVTGQTIPAEIGTARNLRIGRMQLSNVDIAFVDSPAFVALKLTNRPALLLGMNELRAFGRVAIDFPQHKILFDVTS